jgi:hypothetical protein
MRRLLQRVVVLISIVLANSALAESAVQDEHERLERALGQYAQALEEPDRDKRIAAFAQAEYGFASVVAEGVENAALQTNLGNAALQS